jgi:limonene-1,2-epoxide hydrolase
MTNGALAVVEDWHDAVNGASVDRVRALSADQVHVLGSRGSGVIASGDLGDWMIRSGFSATPERWVCGADGTVVVERSARWEDRRTGSEIGRSKVATHFKVEDRLVVTVRRHADLRHALEDAGLSLSNEVTERS